jgi:hypothetical protein
VHGHGIVSHILDASQATAALQAGFQFGGDSGPDFDAGSVLYIIVRVWFSSSNRGGKGYEQMR